MMVLVAALVISSLPRLLETMADSEVSSPVRVSVTMVSRRTGLLMWSPPEAFLERDFQVVFAPEGASYKVVLPVSDPVGNSVRLTDLRPYTAYTLSIRSKDSKNQVIAALNFSTSVMGPDQLAVSPPGAGDFSNIQIDEVFIVLIVLLVWAGAVYIFFNQWGKIRGIIPYQPAFRKFDVVEGPLEMADEGAALISGNCPQCETRQFHLCRKALTFDELMASATAASAGSHQFYQYDRYSYNGLRKSRSAESVLCQQRPRIVVGDADSSNGVGDYDDRDGGEAVDGSRSADGIDGEDTVDEKGDLQVQADELQQRTDKMERAESTQFLQPPPTNLRGGHHNASNSTGTPSPTSPSPCDHVSEITPATLVARARMVETSRRAFMNILRQSSTISGPSTAQRPSSYMAVSPVAAASFDSAALSPTRMHFRPFSPFHPYDHVIGPSAVAAAAAAAAQSPQPSSTAAAAAAVHFLSRRQYSSAQMRRQTSEVENTIPLTTTFYKRMCKKQPSGQSAAAAAAAAAAIGTGSLGGPGNGGGGVGNNSPGCGGAIGVPHQRRSDPDHTRRKLSPYSVDSTDSTKSSFVVPPSTYLLSTPYFSCSSTQRMGSLRSRLKKQHPILQSDSDSNPPDLSVDREETFGGNSSGSNKRVAPSAEHQQHQQNLRVVSAELHQDGWSVASENDAAQTNKVFWHYGSENVLKSESSSRDSKDLDHATVARGQQQESERSGNVESSDAEGGAYTRSTKDIFLSVPYCVDRNNAIL